MKRWIAMSLVLCGVLCACAAPDAPTAPVTSAPTTTAGGSENTDPPVTTLPVETTLPQETGLSTETTQSPAFASYTTKIDDPETLIYTEPGFRYPCTASVGEAGVYTIVAEATDLDGNLWGKLKSGLGWVCLTDPAMMPIFADYAPDHFVASESWHCGETEYVTHIAILPNEHITDITVSLLGIDPAYCVEEVLYTLDSLDADEPLKLSVVFWGDLTTYGISFTDAEGNERYYAMMISGKDGSLWCSEYIPPEVK